MRNITEIKQAEESLRARIRQQEIVAGLGGKALRGADINELLDEAVVLITENLRVEFCKVLELLPNGKELFLRAGVGWKEGLVGQAKVGTDLDSQAGFTLMSGEPVIVDDFRKETRFRGPKLLVDHEIISGVSVIIFGKNQPYGVLGVHTSRKYTFLKEDVYFIQGIANVLGEAIENKHYLEQLTKQESFARLGEMATIVAHEVKNPLAGLSGALEMLKRRASTGTFEREICDEMIERMAQLTNTVNDILVFARPRKPNFQTIPIFILLDDALSIVSKDPSFAEVETKVIGKDLKVEVDIEMIKPVFLNVLVNAAEAMRGKGKINIEVESDLKGLCNIHFMDTGPGIPEENQQNVFDPFYTNKGSGTGLGLSIARRIVELHGGDITLECPPPGWGCVFGTDTDQAIKVDPINICSLATLPDMLGSREDGFYDPGYRYCV